MTARRIFSHLARAYLGLVEASRLTAGKRPINAPLAIVEAKQAVQHLVDAATLISPSAGVRVAEAARRAFDDAHRRAVARDLDAHGLDEGGAASCAAEGTGGHVVDVVAGGADEDGLHEGERSTVVARAIHVESVGYFSKASLPSHVARMSSSVPMTEDMAAFRERLASMLCACGAGPAFDVVESSTGEVVDRVCKRCADALREGTVQ